VQFFRNSSFSSRTFPSKPTPINSLSSHTSETNLSFLLCLFDSVFLPHSTTH
jgi:hypothetical protein